MEEIYEFLSRNTFYLATVDGDCPDLRPFGAVMIFEDKLYICTSNQKSVYKQIQANPHVVICAFDGKRWLRLRGELATDHRREAREAMLEFHPHLKKIYSPDDGRYEVLYFTKGIGIFESYGVVPKTVKKVTL
jgi:uncharacterized pyridoxamine 5'-phosphate oxidase family protein